MAPSVLIIGASGRVGRPLVQEFLRNKKSFSRVAVLADPAKISPFNDIRKDGVDVVVGSFLESSSYKDFDTVISIVGRLPVKLQPGMIDAAIAAGVRHFYPSELGGAITHGTLGKMRWFRDKVVTREHLQQRAREVHGFAYTLLVTGAFTETAVSIFNGVDVEKHTAAPYGSPDALLTVTALPDIVKYIVESVLLPLKPGQSSRELRVAGETLTWAKLMDTLGAVQGVRYTTTYLNVADAAAKQEESRVAGDADSEMVWAGKMVMATGVARIPGPFDNARFSFTPESAKETLQRVFGKQ